MFPECGFLLWWRFHEFAHERFWSDIAETFYQCSFSTMFLCSVVHKPLVSEPITSSSLASVSSGKKTNKQETICPESGIICLVFPSETETIFMWEISEQTEQELCLRETSVLLTGFTFIDTNTLLRLSCTTAAPSQFIYYYKTGGYKIYVFDSLKWNGS